MQAVGATQKWSKQPYEMLSPLGECSFTVRNGIECTVGSLCSDICVQDIGFGLWVIGIICAAALAVSIVLSFAEFFASVTDQCGRHTAGLAFPMGCVSEQNLACIVSGARIRMVCPSMDCLHWQPRHVHTFLTSNSAPLTHHALFSSLTTTCNKRCSMHCAGSRVCYV